MNEPDMTAYALWIAAAALMGLAGFVISGKKLPRKTALRAAALAVPMAVIGARLLYSTVRIRWFGEIGFENFLWPADPDHNYWGDAQGFGLWGAAAGTVFAAWIASSRDRKRFAETLDCMAPWAAVTIGLSRFGEFLIGEGYGLYVENEALWFFPVAVVDEWSAKYAVFMLEGLAALIIAAILFTAGRKYSGGNRARLFLILYSSCQIILESLRQDQCLRWQFMKVSQLISALVLAGLIIAAARRDMKKPEAQRMSTVRRAVCISLFAACVVIVVLLEFAIDKSPTLPVWAAYVLETLCCAVMCAVTLALVIPGKNRGMEE